MSQRGCCEKSGEGRECLGMADKSFLHSHQGVVDQV